MRPYTAFHTKCELSRPVVQVLCRSTSAGRCINPDMLLHRIRRTSTSFSLIPMHLLVYPSPYGYDSLVIGHWSYMYDAQANAAYSAVPLVMRS